MVLEAVFQIVVRRHGEILHYGEDGRLAQPVLELLRLQHVDAAAFSTWLDALAAPLFEEPRPEFDAGLFAAQRNSRNLLFTLYVSLSLDPAPNPVQTAALASLRTLLLR
jgi:hypothetical protein